MGYFVLPISVKHYEKRKNKQHCHLRIVFESNKNFTFGFTNALEHIKVKRFKYVDILALRAGSQPDEYYYDSLKKQLNK